jgi:hypothetical protein
MEYSQIYYCPNTYDNLVNRSSSFVSCSNTDKNILKKMLIELKEMDFLLYAIEIMEKQVFSFEIPNFSKYKESIIDIVYSELIDQLINEYRDYEDVFYSEIRKHFRGMTFDINLLYTIDRKFNTMGIKVVY